MKRISLLSVSMLAILCTSIKANDYNCDGCYVPLRYQTRWSPYSQSMITGPVHYNPHSISYGNSGLVSEYLEYAPYNISYGNNGLVLDTLRYAPYDLKYGSNNLIDYCEQYTPYEFGYNNVGLVYNGSCGYCCQMYGTSTMMNILSGATGNYSYQSNLESINAQKYAERKACIAEQKERIKKLKEEKANDPSEAISQILKSKNIPFRTDRYLQIDGKTVSVNFNIEDANIIIKFWNSEEITELGKENGYKKMGYENYLESWKDYCLKYIGSTKKVYNIIAGSKEEVYKQLDFNDNSKSGDTVYVIAKDELTNSVNH
jgi:hypothetical protein